MALAFNITAGLFFLLAGLISLHHGGVIIYAYALRRDSRGMKEISSRFSVVLISSAVVFLATDMAAYLILRDQFPLFPLFAPKALILKAAELYYGRACAGLHKKREGLEIFNRANPLLRILVIALSWGIIIALSLAYGMLFFLFLPISLLLLKVNDHEILVKIYRFLLLGLSVFLFYLTALYMTDLVPLSLIPFLMML